jgi:PHD/YefM family antitoxin component YafN of YafNO toxin-antitoxin module
MKHISAVQLRQSVGKVVRMLEKNNEPIILDKGNKAVAVLISIKDFNERFVERAAEEARIELAKKIDKIAMVSVSPTPAEDVLRELRDSREN